MSKKQETENPSNARKAGRCLIGMPMAIIDAGVGAGYSIGRGIGAFVTNSVGTVRYGGSAVLDGLSSLTGAGSEGLNVAILEHFAWVGTKRDMLEAIENGMLHLKSAGLRSELSMINLSVVGAGIDAEDPIPMDAVAKIYVANEFDKEHKLVACRFVTELKPPEAAKPAEPAAKVTGLDVALGEGLTQPAADAQPEASTTPPPAAAAGDTFADEVFAAIENNRASAVTIDTKSLSVKEGIQLLKAMAEISSSDGVQIIAAKDVAWADKKEKRDPLLKRLL